MVLSPNMDAWSDETRLPDVVTDIDTGVDTIRQIADAAGMLGVDWGSWVDQNSTIVGTSTGEVVRPPPRSRSSLPFPWFGKVGITITGTSRS